MTQLFMKITNEMITNCKKYIMLDVRLNGNEVKQSPELREIQCSNIFLIRINRIEPLLNHFNKVLIFMNIL